jgi:hypothetical protein
MDFYNFAMTGFFISDTRSRHEDTLRLSHAVSVDGDIVAYDFVSLGDFNNGDYATQDYVRAGEQSGIAGVVINDPLAKVAFTFQLINAGNGSRGELDGRTVATADQLAGIGAGLAGAGAASVGAAAGPVAVAALVSEAAIDFYSWLTVDCDGPVAVDQISGPRYVIDAWADDDHTGTIFVRRQYPGSDSPDGCGRNSNYDVTWQLQHYRGWDEITNSTEGSLVSATGISAATHNGALHVFGNLPGRGVSHARTFTGAAWSVDIGLVWSVNALGSSGLADLPVSAVSFNDRLYVFGVNINGTISSLAFTVDGGSWIHDLRSPPALQTAESIATTAFLNRLYLFARDSATGTLRFTSSADLESWNPWVSVPASGLSPDSPVAAAVLHDTLYIFGVYQTGKESEPAVVVWNSTLDGRTWTGWDTVEAGAGSPNKPLDVAATVFRDRIYIASRWESSDLATYFVSVNFSEDGANWSGWREPESTVQYQPSAAAGLAAVGNHLYIVTPQIEVAANDNTRVFAH